MKQMMQQQQQCVQYLIQFQWKAVVVIGEGEMDEAPMLYIGEKLGLGNGWSSSRYRSRSIRRYKYCSTGRMECTDSTSNCRSWKSYLHAPDMYMEKIAVGPEAAGKVDINASVT